MCTPSCFKLVVLYWNIIGFAQGSVNFPKNKVGEAELYIYPYIISMVKLPPTLFGHSSTSGPSLNITTYRMANYSIYLTNYTIVLIVVISRFIVVLT